MLQKDLEEAIKKNLSSEVGELLRKELEQAEHNKQMIVVLEKQIKDFRQELLAVINERDNYRKMSLTTKELDEKERLLAKERFELDLTILKEQLKSETEKTNFAKEVALGLVRNTSYRKQIYDSENQAPYSNGNHMVYPTPVHKHYTETKHEE